MIQVPKKQIDSLFKTVDKLALAVEDMLVILDSFDDEPEPDKPEYRKNKE